MTEQFTDDSEDLKKTPTDVHFTEDELSVLATADPEDPTVGELMSAHGIKFDEDILVHVEGQPDAIYTTNKDDFMTRDKAASEGWNDSVGAAQGILDLENKIDEQSRVIEAEAVEHGAERISFEEAQKIGEPPVDGFGIEDPSETDETEETVTDAHQEQLQNELAQARMQYDNLTRSISEATATEVNKGARQLEEASDQIRTANIFVRSLDDDTMTLRRVVNGVESGSYDSSSARTLLDTVLQNLQVTHSRLRNVDQDSIPDVRRSVHQLAESMRGSQIEFRRNDSSFNEHSSEFAESNPDVKLDAEPVSSEGTVAVLRAMEGPIDDVLQIVGSVGAEADENAQALRRIISQLDDVKSASYGRPVDIDAIQMLVGQVNAVVQNSQRLGMFNSTLDDAISGMKSTTARLRAE